MTITRPETNANFDELNKLADFLETVPRKNFDMSDWVRTPWKNKEKLLDGFVTLDSVEYCGTVCCVAGWYVLSLGKRVNTVADVFNGVFRGKVVDVAQQELGLTNDEKDVLFYDWQWPRTRNGKLKFESTPKGAANRIRYFIKTGK